MRMTSLLLVVLLFILPCAYTMCPTSSAYKTPGDYWLSLPAGRVALLHVPAAYDGVSALPLMLHFHGWGWYAQQEADWTGFSYGPSDQGGNFFVVYPQGQDQSWNSGGTCCGPSGASGVDDIGFIKQLLDLLTKSLLCVNLNKIYATGMSNGGYFTHRLGCQADSIGYPLAGIGTESGLFYNAGPNSYSCETNKPLPFIHFQGTADDVVKYDWVNSTIQFWAGMNGCDWNSQATTYTNGDAICYGLRCPNPTTNNITVCLVINMGHTWAGAGGSGTTSIYATWQMWNFLKQYTYVPPSTNVPTYGYIQSKASGLYVTIAADKSLVATASSASAAAMFNFTIITGTGQFAIQSSSTLQYVCADNWGSSPLNANRASPSGWETFIISNPSPGYFAVTALANSRYVAIQPASGNQLTATVSTGSTIPDSALFRLVGPVPTTSINVATGARVKLFSRSAGVFVMVDSTNSLSASTSSFAMAATFTIGSISGGLTMQNSATAQYVCADNWGWNPLVANRGGTSLWETFVFNSLSGSYSIQSAVNNNLVAVQSNNVLLANVAPSSSPPLTALYYVVAA